MTEEPTRMSGDELREEYRRKRLIPMQEQALEMLRKEVGKPDLTLEEVKSSYADAVNPDWLADQVLWGYFCIQRVEVAWDQWARTLIICEHGTFSGVSDYMTFMIGQSMLRATEAFFAAEHPDSKEE